MKKFVFGLSAAVLISAVITPAYADTIVNTQVEQGPAAVVDSWMEPSVVRTKEIKTSDGETQVVREPLVLERHERVVIPTTESTTTTTVNEPKVIRRTESRSEVRKVATAPRKKVRRAHKRKRAVAYRRPAVSKRDRMISQKVVEEYREPTVVQQTQHNVRKDVVIERRHPALDLY